MIDVELSNIWGSVSLPDLLSGEKDLFDAHMQLRTNQPDGPDFLGWLNAPEGVMARAVLSIGKAAERIAELGDTLVIVGSGDAPAAAQAAIRALGAASGLELIFAGTSLSTSAYEQLCTRLEGTDFCLLLTAQDAVSIECGIASRAVRWLLDRRYGPEARQHIFVCAPQGSLLHTMAKEEGYTFLPQPAQLGCADSALSPAALLPMAAAGIEPLALLEGAEQAYHDYDLRAFENPAWMYAGARHALELRARRTEFLGGYEPALPPFAPWVPGNTAPRTCRRRCPSPAGSRAIPPAPPAAAATACCRSRRSCRGAWTRWTRCSPGAGARSRPSCACRCRPESVRSSSTGRTTMGSAISPATRWTRRTARCSTRSCRHTRRSTCR